MRMDWKQIAHVVGTPFMSNARHPLLQGVQYTKG